MPERTVPNPIAFRAVMIALGAVQTVDGLWALFAPRSFYDDFPLGRGGWVSALPSYSEHLVTDIGALFLGTGVLLLLAAAWLERRVVIAALVTYLLFSVPHTVWHLTELGPYDGADLVGNVVTLAATVIAPLALLAALARSAPRARAAAPPADGNARLPGVQRPGLNPVLRYAYRSTRKQFGHVVDPVKVTAHHPTLLFGWGMFELATERSHRMPERLKELAVLKTAQLTGCEWCLDFGSAVVRAKGITDEELRALLDYRNSDLFSEEDKLVLDYADAMTRTPVEVPDELFARLRERFDEAQLVELTSIIALENYRGRFNWAMGIAGEGFSEGAYCVRPQQGAEEGHVQTPVGG
jgi:AhpD family alkylhydroperoxidase